MNINDLFESIKLTEKLALENYQQRNGVVDYRLDGVGGVLWGIWEVFVTLGVDKLRSLVYACFDHKVSAH